MIVGPIYFFSLFSKTKESKIILVFIIVIQIILTLLSSKLVIDFRNSNPGLIKDLSIEYINSSFIFILTLVATYTLKMLLSKKF